MFMPVILSLNECHRDIRFKRECEAPLVPRIGIFFANTPSTKTWYQWGNSKTAVIRESREMGMYLYSQIGMMDGTGQVISISFK